MPIELVRPTPQDVPELSRICFEAFGQLQDRHGVARDFHALEVAEMVIGMMTQRPDFYGTAAKLDGKLVGSNFLQMSDGVAAVGPITVDPKCQARGVGRALMQDVLREGRARGFQQIRLLQEAINSSSISLYTSLGFDWREAIALIDPTGAAKDDSAVRPATKADLDNCDALCMRTYHHSRRNEVDRAMQAGFPVFLRERAGSIRGYLMPGFLGHGVAETDEDLVALIGHAMKNVPPPFQRILLPLGQADLHRKLLAAGARTVKLFNYMTAGEFKPPNKVWLCSIGW